MRDINVRRIAFVSLLIWGVLWTICGAYGAIKLIEKIFG